MRSGGAHFKCPHGVALAGYIYVARAGTNPRLLNVLRSHSLDFALTLAKRNHGRSHDNFVKLSERGSACVNRNHYPHAGDLWPASRATRCRALRASDLAHQRYEPTTP